MKVTSVSNVTNFFTTKGGEFATCGKNAAGVWCRIIGRDGKGEPVFSETLIEEEIKSIRSTVTLYFDTAIKTIPVDDNGNSNGEDIDTNSMVVRIDVLHAQLRHNTDVSMLLNNYDLEAFLPGCQVNVTQTAVAKGEAIPNTDATYSKDMYANQIEVTGLSDAGLVLKAADLKATVIEQLYKAHPNLPIEVVLAMAK
jgi:hypothetical protein